MDRPHVVFLMPDQQRGDCMGAVGHPAIRTPNMDRLARQGVCFRNATTVSPLCMPTRVGFINGLYPHCCGTWGNSDRPASEDSGFLSYHNPHDEGVFADSEIRCDVTSSDILF